MADTKAADEEYNIKKKKKRGRQKKKKKKLLAKHPKTAALPQVYQSDWNPSHISVQLLSSSRNKKVIISVLSSCLFTSYWPCSYCWMPMPGPCSCQDWCSPWGYLSEPCVLCEHRRGLGRGYAWHRFLTGHPLSPPRDPSSHPGNLRVKHTAA